MILFCVMVDQALIYWQFSILGMPSWEMDLKYGGE